MSILMSDSLKGKIDVASLELDKKELKVEASFYCVFQTGNGNYYFPLDKLHYHSDKNYTIRFSTEHTEDNCLADILNFKNNTKIKVYLANSEEDVCIEQVNYQSSQIKLESIERQNLSGYNYIITIFINEM